MGSSNVIGWCKSSALAALLCLASGHVQAVPLFEADATASLIFEEVSNLTTPGDIGDLDILLDAFVVSNQVDFSGTATASTMSNAETIDTGLALSAAANGNTGPAGTAEAEFFTEGSIILENLSATDTFLVELLFSYSTTAIASIANPATDFALAEGIVEILSDSGTFDDVFQAVADSDLDIFLSEFSDSIGLSVTLTPGTSETITLLVDANGFASVDVSEPSTLLLLLLLPFALLAIKRT